MFLTKTVSFADLLKLAPSGDFDVLVESAYKKDGILLYTLNNEGWGKYQEMLALATITSEAASPSAVNDPPVFKKSILTGEEIVNYLYAQEISDPALKEQLLSKLYLLKLIRKNNLNPGCFDINITLDITAFKSKLEQFISYSQELKCPISSEKVAIFWEEVSQMLTNTLAASGSKSRNTAFSKYGPPIAQERLQAIIRTDNPLEFSMILKRMTNMHLVHLIGQEVYLNKKLNSSQLSKQLKRLSNFAYQKSIELDSELLSEVFTPLARNSASNKTNTRKRIGPPRPKRKIILLGTLITTLGVLATYILDKLLRNRRSSISRIPSAEPTTYPLGDEFLNKRFELFNSNNENRFIKLGNYPAGQQIPFAPAHANTEGYKRYILYDKFNHELCLYYIDIHNPWGKDELIFKPLRAIHSVFDHISFINGNDPVNKTPDLRNAGVLQKNDLNDLGKSSFVDELWNELISKGYIDRQGVLQSSYLSHPDEDLRLDPKFQSLKGEIRNTLHTANTQSWLKIVYYEDSNGDIWQANISKQDVSKAYECIQKRSLFLPAGYIKALNQQRQTLRPNETMTEINLVSLGKSIALDNLLSLLNGQHGNKYHLKVPAITTNIFTDLNIDISRLLDQLHTSGYVDEKQYLSPDFWKLNSFEQMQISNDLKYGLLDLDKVLGIAPEIKKHLGKFFKYYVTSDKVLFFFDKATIHKDKLVPLSDPQSMDFSIITDPVARQALKDLLTASANNGKEIYQRLSNYGKAQLIVYGEITTTEAAILFQYLPKTQVTKWLDDAATEMSRVLNSELYTYNEKSGLISRASPTNSY